MSQGKQDRNRPRKGAPGAESRRAAAAPPSPPTPEEKPSGPMGTILLVIVLGVAGVVAWKKFAPKTVQPKEGAVVQEKEIAWTSEVDGARAMEIAKRLCFPRVAGTPGSKAARELLKAELQAAGIDQFHEQAFTAKTPLGEREFVNCWGVLPGKRKEGVALAAHYDSKHYERFAFVGANDAASACGLVVELARKLRERRTEPAELSTYFVFFDGEEAFHEHWGDQEDGTPDHTYGSRHMAARPDDPPIKALILMDMVGEEDISFVDDSEGFAPELLHIFKETSRKTFGKNFFTQRTGVVDDHVPFMKAGVPSIDLIDFKFGVPESDGSHGHWHTPNDTPDKLHRRGFDLTGTLVLKALPDVERTVVKRL
ncbi:MAG TPA: M28 family peptidase [Planctomycetota bacterium]|nr:M28 family peptidase [Planctomycetota bacterium]